jgi:hypothetical protein
MSDEKTMGINLMDEPFDMEVQITDCQLEYRRTDGSTKSDNWRCVSLYDAIPLSREIRARESAIRARLHEVLTGDVRRLQAMKAFLEDEIQRLLRLRKKAEVESMNEV